MSKPEVQPFEKTLTSGAAVKGFLHVPANPNGEGLVLTHGAGANCGSPLLVALATAFCQSEMTVLRYDLPFRQRRPHGPPARGSAEHDQEGLQFAVEAMRQQVPGRIFLGGHSYGGRQASMLAAARPELVDALLLLSYPLHPPKRADQPRTDHFSSLHAPALFVHGNRDALGTLEELTAALKLISARTRLMTVKSAGHELVSARTKDAVSVEIVEEFLEFVRR